MGPLKLSIVSISFWRAAVPTLTSFLSPLSPLLPFTLSPLTSTVLLQNNNIVSSHIISYNQTLLKRLRVNKHTSLTHSSCSSLFSQSPSSSPSQQLLLLLPRPQLQELAVFAQHKMSSINALSLAKDTSTPAHQQITHVYARNQTTS